MDLESRIEDIAANSKKIFDKKHAVMSFSEYLGLLAARPYTLTRNAAQYLKDLFDHHGRYEVESLGGVKRSRWTLFDDPARDGRSAVFGQEEVQERLYSILAEFVQAGRADKFILLHGPNGSSKTSVVDCMVSGLEQYSRHDEGQLYRLSWIFCEAGDRQSMGFSQTAPLEELNTFAHVDERMISSRIPCEMKDPPFFLLPKKRRKEFLEAALEDAEPEQRERFSLTEFVLTGDLSGKNKVIYESLLKAHQGDWKKVLRHIRVERYYLSQRYRTGVVTIEPQTTIDAGARLLGHSSSQGLPPVLAHENLTEASGDLVEANGGIVEYSEFLKRNPEANKYLLTTAERGFVNLPSVTVALNLVLFGSTNEKYLTAFKRDPSFPSFKGRFELVRVPYLREFPREGQIYERHLQKVKGRLEVAPHTATIAAMWAVLTRLRKPESKHFQGLMREALSSLTPLEKLRLYGEGRIPGRLTNEQAKVLQNSLEEVTGEFDPLEEEFEGMVGAAYEGRRGASPREMMTLLTEIAVTEKGACLGPVHLFEALPRIIAEKSLYSYLRMSRQDGYHDPAGFIDLVKCEYVRLIAKEIQKASDLVDEAEYGRLFVEYMTHVKAGETNEKVPNPQTGRPEDPDAGLMESVEKRLGIDEDVKGFRRNLMSKAAAWRLSNLEEPLVLETLFSDLFRALEKSFFRERQDRILTIVGDALALDNGVGDELVQDRRDAAKKMSERLHSDFGYGPAGLSVMLSYFQKHHELLED